MVSKDSYLPVNNELANKHPNFRWSDDRVLMPIYVMPMVSEYWILCSTFDTFIIYLSSSKWQSLSAVLTLSSKELCSSLSPSVSVSPMSRLPAESASWPFLNNRKMFTTCSRPRYDHRQAFTDMVSLNSRWNLSTIFTGLNFWRGWSRGLCFSLQLPSGAFLLVALLIAEVLAYTSLS